MSKHSSTQQNSFHPPKTSTLVFAFVALAAAIIFGLQVGSNISVQSDVPAVSLPAAQQAPTATATPSVVAVEVAEPTTEIVAEPAAHAVSVSPKVTGAPQPRTYVAPAPAVVTVTETSTAAPVTVTEQAPIVTPDPASGDEKDTPESNCIQQGMEWDGTQCVAVQLPEEIIGRVVDGPDGQICTIVDVEGNVQCVAPETDEFEQSN